MLRLGIFLLFVAPIWSNNFDKCGQLHSGSNSHFVIGGYSEEINAPWVAAVGKCDNDCGRLDKFTVSCSGAILTRKFIVTAAHCFTEIGRVKKENFPNYVKVGANTINDKFAEDRKIKDYVNHPDFKFPVYYFDVALIVLEEELTFSARISPICLPQTASNYPDNVPISVQGWGKDGDGSFGQRLSDLSVGIRVKNECDHEFRTAGVEHGAFIGKKVKKVMPELSRDTLFCARANLNSQVGTCIGDSGGPAVEL